MGAVSPLQSCLFPNKVFFGEPLFCLVLFLGWRIWWLLREQKQDHLQRESQTLSEKDWNQSWGSPVPWLAFFCPGEFSLQSRAPFLGRGLLQKAFAVKNSFIKEPGRPPPGHHFGESSHRGSLLAGTVHLLSESLGKGNSSISWLLRAAMGRI